MKQQDTEFWTKASQAREELASQLKDHPDVCSVDIGYPQDASTAQGEISIRIHACNADGGFPVEIDGIPVVVSHGKE